MSMGANGPGMVFAGWLKVVLLLRVFQAEQVGRAYGMICLGRLSTERPIINDIEIHWWLFAGRKILLFVSCFGGAVLLPILSIRHLSKKARERERLQMRILDELDRFR